MLQSQGFKLAVSQGSKIFWNYDDDRFKCWISLLNTGLTHKVIISNATCPVIQAFEKDRFAQCRDSSALTGQGKEWYKQRKKKNSWIQLIFYCMKVSQGRLESHVNTIPEYRFVSLFYKSRSPESLSDHYYHTNRQIYLTTVFYRITLIL